MVVSVLVRSIVLSASDKLSHARGPLTPISVITAVMTILDTYKNLRGMQKRELLVAAVDIIARGPDGIEGTADDIVSPEVSSVLRNLIETNTIADIVDHLIAMRSAIPPWLLAWLPPCLKPVVETAQI